MDNYYTQRGNALLFILIGIALLTMVTFAVSSGRHGMSNAQSDENARLYVSEMIQYGDSLRAALETMNKLASVPDTAFSFAASGAHADYGTPDAVPTNEVFSPAGGGSSFGTPPAGACNAACVYEFTGQITVKGLGVDTRDELSMVVTGLTDGVCTMLNRTQKYSWWAATPTDEKLVTLTRFAAGNYGQVGPDPNAIVLGNGGGSLLPGLRSFCYKEAGAGGRNIFVHVLRSR